VEVLVGGLPRWDCPAAVGLRLSQGQEVPGPQLAPGTEMAVFAEPGRFIGVGRMEASGRVAPLRLMSPAAGAEAP
jgi:hypothetical protein